MLSIEARDNLPALPVHMSLSFLRFYQSRYLLSHVEAATLRSPEALRATFLKTFDHVLKLWGIQKES